MHDKRNQDCHEGTFKGNSGENSGRSEGSCKGSFHPQEYTNNYEQTVGRNVNDEGHFGDVWVRNEAYAIR